MTLVCITNDMDDIRSCTVHDQHQSSCDGIAYRHNTVTGLREPTWNPCRGCLPKDAEHGLLCWSCWERVKEAYAAWPRFAEVISGITRAAQLDNGGVGGSSEGYVPIPATRLSVDEVESFLRCKGDQALEVWVSQYFSAMDAVHFARAAQAAYNAHPIEEKPHRVKRVRCAKCGQLSLMWTPPRYSHDPVTVTCQNKECDGLTLDQRSFELASDVPERKQPTQ